MLYGLKGPPCMTVFGASKFGEVAEDGVGGIFVIGDAWDWLWEEDKTEEVESGNDGEEKRYRKALGSLLIQINEDGRHGHG